MLYLEEHLGSEIHYLAVSGWIEYQMSIEHNGLDIRDTDDPRHVEVYDTFTMDCVADVYEITYDEYEARR